MIHKILEKTKYWQLSRKIEKTRSICVTFTGGLGAQILSYGIYKNFTQRGYLVSADLNYFEKKPYIAPVNKGEVSIWKWELNSYGVNSESLDESYSEKKTSIPTVHDGKLKLSLALKAFKNPLVKNSFNLEYNDKYSYDYRCKELGGRRYLCIHVRRGDYLNVASHLVNCNEIESIALQASELVDRVLILSDSLIEINKFIELRKAFNGRVHIIDNNPDPILAHSLMRNAFILICCNSQFSLSAGLLSKGFVVIPKIWFGDKFNEINEEIENLYDFAILRK